METLKVIGITKSFGPRTLFENVSFEINRGDKVGLIGANGTGKTTLIRCVMGLESIDSGKVSWPTTEPVGYVDQVSEVSGGTLYEELRSAFDDVLAHQARMRELEIELSGFGNAEAPKSLLEEYSREVQRFEHGGGYFMESQIRKVAFGLGFLEEDFCRPVGTFSGGQKTRINLARALIRQPDWLFLDEPTNHLDMERCEWLEEFLRDYAGAVLIVSHDRYFLDRVVGEILELEGQTLTEYKADYSGYVIQKAERLAAQTTAYEKQQEYIEKTEAYIDRFRAGIKSKQARGRQSQLSRLERLKRPDTAEALRFGFPKFEECPERVAELLDAKASYGERVVFANLSLLVRRGDGLALVGPNGAGKTTLLKLLTGELMPAGGRVKIGPRATIGYYSQELDNLTSHFRVLDEAVVSCGLSEERSRNLLGMFLFRGDDVFKQVSDLSGGEKARLGLLKLMLSGANFLVLDEPTNHLDIPAREAVEAAVIHYPGTFIVVSHDRYFLDKVADRVIDLRDGCLREYSGNYSDYREELLLQNAQQAKTELAIARETPAMDRRAKTASPLRREQDRQKSIIRLEREIQSLEEAKAGLELRLSDPASHADPVASQTLADEYAGLELSLRAKYDEWAELEC